MIPKIIHYCWFGNGPMPQLAIKCMDSWKRYLPEYELKLWNEESFDINSVPYVKEAYSSRKYAFVTDYVRLYVLYHFGGVYMDTDVEVLKSYNDLLNYPAFSGFESEDDVPTGTMASEKHGAWAKEQLEYYKDIHFIRPDGSFDLTTNCQIISGIMSKNGFILENGYQVYKDSMHMFPYDYFCAKSRAGKVTITENTYCIHHFAGSWNSTPKKIKKFFFRKIVGAELTQNLISIKRLLKKKFVV